MEASEPHLDAGPTPLASSSSPPSTAVPAPARGIDPSRPLPPHKARQLLEKKDQSDVKVAVPSGLDLSGLSLTQPRARAHPAPAPAAAPTSPPIRAPDTAVATTLAPAPASIATLAEPRSTQPVIFTSSPQKKSHIDPAAPPRPSRASSITDVPRSAPSRSKRTTSATEYRVVNEDGPLRKSFKGGEPLTPWQPSSIPPARPNPPMPSQPGPSRHAANGGNFSRRGPNLVQSLDMTPETPLLTVNGLPNNIDSRHFRKKIGHAIKGVFAEPPRFKAKLHMRRGVTEYGLVTFPTPAQADQFLRAVTRGNPRNRPSNVEIGKQYLTFTKSDPTRHRLSRQELASLKFRPENALEDAPSDYEDEADAPADAFVHFCELGMWDEKGRFAPAWQSNQFDDHHSIIDLDADQGRLRIRLDHQLISMSLHRVTRMVVDEDDLYIENDQLPMYLADDSDASGDAAWYRRQLGAVQIDEGLPRDKYVRLDHLDEVHAKVTPFCFVVKVRCRDEEQLSGWINRWESKLTDLIEILEINRDMQNTILASHLQTLQTFYSTIAYPLAFQAQKLLHSGMILPLEAVKLMPVLRQLDARLRPREATIVFEGATLALRHREPAKEAVMPFDSFVKHLESSLAHAVSGSLPGLSLRDTGPEDIFIHSTVITPSTLFLQGPFLDEGNRIIRLYPGQEENFMRVALAEEDGSRIWDSAVIDQDTHIYTNRWRTFLTDGISVGGRAFHFLAFSTSSLKQHTVWFVADFTDAKTGEAVSAEIIRAGIGDLEQIRIPAKYAARMGQAFTTTGLSVGIEADKVGVINDIIKVWHGHEYDFSDGCGTLSSVAVERLHKRMVKRRRGGKKRVMPTVFQIRMAGAKGVLALDSTIPPEGEEVRIRGSMTKFKVDTAEGATIPLEVASTADRPLTFYLNRPLIALLETLGVPIKKFLALQDKALASLREAVTSTEAAIRLHLYSGYGKGPNVIDLFQTLARVLQLDAVDIEFLRRCNLTCLTASLKRMKYKARIQVDEACTLMGVVDETGWLKEGEIYAQTRVGLDGGKVEIKFLKGRCIIGRSPYLAPGDVQFATLKGEPPEGSPLRDLYNCVVFSQHGNRPLPHQLAGGDLDGDLYNIIQNRDLFPERTVKSAGYRPAVPTELPRPCTIEDVIDFFLLFIQTDRIGAIADRHLCLSDRSPKGVEDYQCVALAEMAAIAVDYQKSGVAPDWRSMPKLPDDAKPDYQQPESRVDVGTKNSPITPERRRRWQREQYSYYESHKALGQLFRRIEVSASIDKWGKNAPPTIPDQNLRSQIWAKLTTHLPAGWDSDGLDHELAQVASFAQRMQTLAQNYSPEYRSYALSECEVFMGVILTRPSPRGSAGAARAHDSQAGLRDEFSELIDDFMGEACNKRSDARANSNEAWDAPIIDAATLRETCGNDEGRERLAAEARAVLVQLARWIKAAEKQQDRQGVRGGGNLEAAKWIAIGPALKKCEELELWELSQRRER